MHKIVIVVLRCSTFFMKLWLYFLQTMQHFSETKLLVFVLVISKKIFLKTKQRIVWTNNLAPQVLTLVCKNDVDLTMGLNRTYVLSRLPIFFSNHPRTYTTVNSGQTSSKSSLMFNEIRLCTTCFGTIRQTCCRCLKEPSLVNGHDLTSQVVGGTRIFCHTYKRNGAPRVLVPEEKHVVGVCGDWHWSGVLQHCIYDPLWRGGHMCGSVGVGRKWSQTLWYCWERQQVKGVHAPSMAMSACKCPCWPGRVPTPYRRVRNFQRRGLNLLSQVVNLTKGFSHT